MKVIRWFQIIILMPILFVLTGCGIYYDRTTAFYKPEATRGQFTLDYKACHEPVVSKAILKTGVPFRTIVCYEWVEGDRANTWMLYEAMSEDESKFGKKGRTFLSEYGMHLDQCMKEKGWIIKKFQPEDGFISILYPPPDRY